MLLFGITTLSSQTVWLGQTSTDWSDVSNWSNGLPGPGNNASVPSEPPGDFLPVMSQALTIDFTIENANMLVFQAPVNNSSGTIINFENASIAFEQGITNLSSFDNDGQLIIDGNFINQSDFNNSGSLLMEAGEQLVNESTGLFENYGDIDLNFISLTNHGQFDSFGGTISTNGYFQNYGTVTNNGTIINEGCGVIRNYNLFNNEFIITNENLIYNEADFIGNPINEQTGVQNSSGLTVGMDECQGPEGWTHFTNTIDDKILISIKTNGQDIGSIFDESLTIRLRNESTLGIGGCQNLLDAAYKDWDDWYVLNRFWFIKSTRTITEPLKLRFYFQQSDFQDIQRTFPLSQDLNEMFFYHLLSSENGYDTAPTIEDVDLFKQGESGSFDNWSLHEVSFGHYIEIEVNQLNGSYGAGVKSWIGGTIPDLTDFDAKANRSERSVELSWQTSKEKDFAAFRVQRSLNGQSFTNLGTQPANGDTQSSSTYTSVDNNPPLDSTVYYRLILSMTDGTTRISPTRKVSFSNSTAKVIPNPSDDHLYLQFSDIESGSVMVQIYDFRGNMMFGDLIEVQNYQSISNLYDLVNLSNGIYTLQIMDGNQKESIRFLKMSR